MPDFVVVLDQWGTEYTLLTKDIKFFSRNANGTYTLSHLHFFNTFTISAETYTLITGITPA